MIRITNKNVFVLTIHKIFIFLSFPFLNQYEEDTVFCQDFKILENPPVVGSYRLDKIFDDIPIGSADFIYRN
jgi:hypothetical protein